MPTLIKNPTKIRKALRSIAAFNAIVDELKDLEALHGNGEFNLDDGSDPATQWTDADMPMLGFAQGTTAASAIPQLRDVLAEFKALDVSSMAITKRFA